jgi:thioredoxin 1
MITGIVITSVLLAFFAYAYFSMQKMKNTPAVADSAKIKNLTEQNFNQQIKQGVILVDFWASWCAPCKMMAPVLNELAGDLTGDKVVGKLDVEKYQAIAAKYKVRSIPTLILFKDGIEINRFIGMKSKEFLHKEISKVL